LGSSSAAVAEAAAPGRKPWTLVRLISLLITVVSILGAIAAWRASVVSGNAGGLDQQATQERVRQQQIEGEIHAQVDQDLRLFPRYLSHLSTWGVLKEKAAQEQSGNPQLADDLRGDAQEELALARTIYQALSVKPLFGQTNYDEKFSLDYLRQYNLDLVGLAPEETAVLAEEERERGVRMVGIAALFIASLFFLTLAQVGRRTIRQVFGLAGLLIMLGATVALLLTEFG
jgi:hypothetical protein